MAALPAPTDPRKPPKVASVLAGDMTMEGGVAGGGELHVDGTIKGDVSVARLALGETGAIEGAIHADTVEVRGRVIGSITGKLVRLFATAYVDGDITHEQLAIEPGAFFQGRSQKMQPSAASAPEVISLQSDSGDAA